MILEYDMISYYKVSFKSNLVLQNEVCVRLAPSCLVYYNLTISLIDVKSSTLTKKKQTGQVAEDMINLIITITRVMYSHEAQPFHEWNALRFC